MRSMMLAATLVLVSPLAYAQGMPGSATGPGPAYTGAPPPPPSYTRMAAQPDPENCGTPDEPKACPPMPRHPLPYYPNNKQ
jgi:hypothetical protein